VKDPQISGDDHLRIITIPVILPQQAGLATLDILAGEDGEPAPSFPVVIFAKNDPQNGGVFDCCLNVCVHDISPVVVV
jgi:hypothetical protein